MMRTITIIANPTGMIRDGLRFGTISVSIALDIFEIAGHFVRFKNFHPTKQAVNPKKQ